MKTRVLAVVAISAAAIGVVTAGADTPTLTDDGGRLPEPNQIVTTKRFELSPTERQWANAQAQHEPLLATVTHGQEVAIDKVVPWSLNSTDIEDPVGLAVLVHWDAPADFPAGSLVDAHANGRFNSNGRPAYEVQQASQSATGVTSLWLFYDRGTRKLARTLPVKAHQVTASPGWTHQAGEED